MKRREGREGVEGSPFDDERCQGFVRNLEKLLDALGWKKADLARESKYSASLISEIMAFKAMACRPARGGVRPRFRAR